MDLMAPTATSLNDDGRELDDALDSFVDERWRTREREILRLADRLQLLDVVVIVYVVDKASLADLDRGYGRIVAWAVMFHTW
jgi:hypothetical protein